MITLIKENKPIIYAVVALIFIALTCAMTFPLFFRINDSMAGFSSTDEPSLWYFWWLKFSRAQHLDHRNCQFLAYPFGEDYGIFDRLYPLWSAFKKFTANIASPAFAYNIENIISFVLSGFFAYLLFLYVSGRHLAALFCGIIYAFCPYHFARTWQHIGLAHIQWMPLYLYALFRLFKERKTRSVLVLSLALFLVASFDLHYLYFMLIASGAFMVYALRQDHKKNWKVVPLVMIATTAVLLLLAGLIWPVIKTSLFYTGDRASSAWSYNRPFADLFSQSARPLSYFLPSTEHPLFGPFTSRLIGSGIYGSSFTEHALYLGWTPLILAFVAFRRWKKARKLSEVNCQLPEREKFYIGFFIFLTIAAWLFSQPPWWNWFGLKIYMPSFLMYKILPMFRAYCRFGIVVMLAVAVLAGFGLKFVLERFKTHKAKMGITALFCALVLFEFWNCPPFKIIDLSRVPAVYYWLKEQPGDFVVAEYPLDSDSPSEEYKFCQTVHEKKIINGTIPGTEANRFAQKIIRLSDYKTAATLKGMGVKYVLVHYDGYLQTDLVEDSQELARIPKNKGLKLIGSFAPQPCPKRDIMCSQETGPIDVYEVVQ